MAHARSRGVMPLAHLCLSRIADCLRDQVTAQLGSAIRLPADMTHTIIDLLHKRRILNNTTLLPLLHENLQRLDVSHVKNLSVVQVAQRAPCLRSVALRGCLSINDATLGDLSRLRCWPSLTSLCLAYNKRITAAGMESLLASPAATALVDLDLSWCSGVDDPVIPLIGQRCPNVRRISLVTCPRITGTPLPNLTSTCPNLRVLELKGCQACTHARIALPALVTLTLAHCPLLEPQNLHLDCPSLQQLSLGWCALLDDAAIERALAALPRLVVLDLSACTGVRSARIASPSLRWLSLDRCYGLGEPLFRSLGTQCPSLAYLNLNMCSDGVTDDSVFLLTLGCTALEALTLSRCDRITDTASRTIVTTCTRLCLLDVSWCTKLTVASLTAIQETRIQQHNSSLRELRMFGCTNISAGDISAFMRDNGGILVRAATRPTEWALQGYIS